eukprot:2481888-Rhodomonas_salina.1
MTCKSRCVQEDGGCESAAAVRGGGAVDEEARGGGGGSRAAGCKTCIRSECHRVTGDSEAAARRSRYMTEARNGLGSGYSG